MSEEVCFSEEDKKSLLKFRHTFYKFCLGGMFALGVVFLLITILSESYEYITTSLLIILMSGLIGLIVWKFIRYAVSRLIYFIVISTGFAIQAYFYGSVPLCRKLLYYNSELDSQLLCFAILVIFIGFTYDCLLFIRYKRSDVVSGKIDVYSLVRENTFWRYPKNIITKIGLLMGTGLAFGLAFVVMFPVEIKLRQLGFTSAETKGIIGNIFGVFMFYLWMLLIGNTMFKLIVYIKWQIKNNRILHTEFDCYLEKQKLINRFRKEKGLKSININSYFFNKDKI